MKKKITLLATVAVLGISMMACGKEETKETTEKNPVASTEQNAKDEKNDDKKEEKKEFTDLTTVGVLENVWAVYSEDDKPLVMGGNADNSVDGAPGVYPLTDMEGIQSMFHVTEDAVAMADELASAVHAMNANNFTCAAFHLKDASNKDAFAASVKESVLSTRWMCGFPEKLLVISVQDEYVISVFGNGDMMDLFKEKVTEVYGSNATVMAEEIIE